MGGNLYETVGYDTPQCPLPSIYDRSYVTENRSVGGSIPPLGTITPERRGFCLTAPFDRRRPGP